MLETRLDVSMLVNKAKYVNAKIYVERCETLCQWSLVTNKNIPIIDAEHFQQNTQEISLIHTENNTVIVYVNPDFSKYLENIIRRYDVRSVQVIIKIKNDTGGMIQLFLRNIWLNKKPVGSTGQLVHIESGGSIELRLSELAVHTIIQDSVESILVWKPIDE